jgi:dTDP-4-amino-4,6-dideoxygalactose transaminase
MTYRIPLFDLHIGTREGDAIRAALDEGWISMGERTATFEARFAHHLGANHVVAVTNCTAALHLAMVILGLGPGDEVIVPSLTFVATVNAVRYVGATPVFADIHGRDDLSIEPGDVARKVTPRTKAVVVMHYGGYAVDMQPILELARANGLRVVEDAAHAPDSSYRGRKLGTLGDVGCFSFFSNKNITCAEGGALVTDDHALASRARLLRSHGMTTLSYERARGHATAYDVVELGYNYRIDDLRAALLLVQMSRLRKDTEMRRGLVEEYRLGLSEVEEVTVPYRHHPYPSSHHIMSVVLDPGRTRIGRDEVRQRLYEAGIQTSIHYPPVHLFKAYAGLGATLPMTELVARNQLTLPLFPKLRRAQVREVVTHLVRACR